RSEYKVGSHRRQPRPSTLIAHRVHRLRDTATVQARRAYGLAAASRVFLGQLHVEPQLLFEITVARAAAQRAEQAMHPLAKRAHAISSPYCSRSAVSGGSVAAR